MWAFFINIPLEENFYSTDQITEITKTFGIKVVQRKFDNWASNLTVYI
ncbi:Uncharacterized protein dnl_14940 [Desulfonema limicola]|uniref:Uncharacterized protein n=1 Tax=Desulfonema limicola TaxID=45656 RepID=A0A975B5L5_9BACT|nr:Uncharacterized protein dnl_14940 [Desulfonema limicola]